MNVFDLSNQSPNERLNSGIRPFGSFLDAKIGGQEGTPEYAFRGQNKMGDGCTKKRSYDDDINQNQDGETPQYFSNLRSEEGGMRVSKRSRHGDGDEGFEIIGNTVYMTPIMEGYSNYSGLADLRNGEMRESGAMQLGDDSNSSPSPRPRSYSCRFHDCSEVLSNNGSMTIDNHMNLNQDEGTLMMHGFSRHRVRNYISTPTRKEDTELSIREAPDKNTGQQHSLLTYAKEGAFNFVHQKKRQQHEYQHQQQVHLQQQQIERKNCFMCKREIVLLRNSNIVEVMAGNTMLCNVQQGVACHFCNKPFCATACAAPCVSCGLAFCTSCSTVRYTSTCDSVVCLDCNATMCCDDYE